jgi:hypothetical protein
VKDTLITQISVQTVIPAISDYAHAELVVVNREAEGHWFSDLVVEAGSVPGFVDVDFLNFHDVFGISGHPTLSSS